jgi:hypothetical protein
MVFRRATKHDSRHLHLVLNLVLNWVCLKEFGFERKIDLRMLCLRYHPDLADLALHSVKDLAHLMGMLLL